MTRLQHELWQRRRHIRAAGRQWLKTLDEALELGGFRFELVLEPCLSRFIKELNRVTEQHQRSSKIDSEALNGRFVYLREGR